MKKKGIEIFFKKKNSQLKMNLINEKYLNLSD